MSLSAAMFSYIFVHAKSGRVGIVFVQSMHQVAIEQDPYIYCTVSVHFRIKADF